MSRVRVYIVDCRPAMVIGLRTMFASGCDIEVVGDSDNCVSALAEVAVLRPDVVLLHTLMPAEKVTMIASAFRRKLPTVKLAFLVDRGPGGSLPEAPAGADAYLATHTCEEGLTAAIVAIAQGIRAVDVDVAGRVLQNRDAVLRELGRRRVGLSDEEIDVLHRLAEGATNQEIAAALYLSEVTVIRKIRQILAKLGVANRVQAVAEAVRSGIA